MPRAPAADRVGRRARAAQATLLAAVLAVAAAMALPGRTLAQGDAPLVPPDAPASDGTPAPEAEAAFDVTTPFLGWGGPGGQVFTSAISLARNNPNKERQVMVIADDLMVRGPKNPILRCVVVYDAPRDPRTGIWLVPDVGDVVAKESLGRRFEYPMLPLYRTPYSPRAARVLMPQGDGITMRLAFHRTARPTFDRSQDRDAIESLTRQIPVETIMALPQVNPLREYAMRRHGARPTASGGN